MTNRVLVASDYNARDQAHFAQTFEFCSVIASCETADLIAPEIDNAIARHLSRFAPQHDGHNVQRDINRLTNSIRKGLRLKSTPTVEPTEVTQDYELFVFVAWSPQSLVELQRIKNWRSRCKIAVAYLFELWSSTLEQNRAYLKLLDQFDYVFLAHNKCISHLTSYTRAHCCMLPVGVDCMIAAPYPSPPRRVIDVYSIGNRSAPVHRELMELVRNGDFFYSYDSLASTDSRVRNWTEHRNLMTNMIMRSRYFIAFSPASLAESKAGKVAGEQVLDARLFGGAAGGSIILGSTPRCPEFYEYFDWPDAVIEILSDGSDVTSVINELDANPDWTERIRRTNIAKCLLKHDWVYRWEHILSTVGTQPLPQLKERKSRLSIMASAAMEDIGYGEHPAVTALHLDVPAASQLQTRSAQVAPE